jgi:hypothetical protein
MNTQIDAATYQGQLKRDLAFMHRKWQADKTRAWQQFTFCLSLMRALDISWVKIGRVLEMERGDCRNRYWTIIYPVRPDVVEYASIYMKDESVRGQLLRELKELFDRVNVYEVEIYDIVKRFRDSGASWTTVGKALKMTRQAAQQRFGQQGPSRYRRRVPSLVTRDD